jgi:ribonuclease VapC
MSFIVDSSALIAIMKLESDAADYAAMLASAAPRYMSAGTRFECSIVVARAMGQKGLSNLEILLEGTNVETVPFDKEQSEIGLRGYFKYGRGSGHKAGLNFGDCFSYALAMSRKLPLLFKGDDFIYTDVQPALKQVERR